MGDCQQGAVQFDMRDDIIPPLSIRRVWDKLLVLIKKDWDANSRKHLSEMRPRLAGALEAQTEIEVAAGRSWSGARLSPSQKMRRQNQRVFDRGHLQDLHIIGQTAETHDVAVIAGIKVMEEFGDDSLLVVVIVCGPASDVLASNGPLGTHGHVHCRCSEDPFASDTIASVRRINANGTGVKMLVPGRFGIDIGELAR